MTKMWWKTEKKQALWQILLSNIIFMGLGLFIYILFSHMMNGQISVAMFAAIFLSLSDVFSIMDELVSIHLGEGSEIWAQVAEINYILVIPHQMEVHSAVCDGKHKL